MAAATSSRILLDIPCKVCQDHSSGKHYGIFACDGCAGFFKRSIRRNRQYVCKNRGTGQEGTCVVDKTHRNQCRACRLNKCADVGMNKDAVQHERGPRNSTLRRQMALYFKENGIASAESSFPFGARPPLPPMQTPTTPFSLLTPPAAFSTFPRPPQFPFWSPLFSMDPTHKVLSAASPLLVSTSGPFTFPRAPSPVQSMKAAGGSNSLKELAARLLFMTLNWPKSLPQFLALPPSDQLSSLRESWPELFLLAASQFGVLTEENVSRVAETCPTADGLDLLREVALQLHQLQPDPVELSCLRALVLLKSASSLTIDQVQLTLTQYQQLQYISQPMRSVKIMMMLQKLSAIPAALLEQLFFKDSIGDVPMSRLVCDLYSTPLLLPSTSLSQSPSSETSSLP